MQTNKRKKLHNKNMTETEPVVFILAGGKGSRMRSSTKSLIKIDPKNPDVLERNSLGRILSQIQSNGISKVVIFGGRNKAVIEEFIAEHGEKLSLKVSVEPDIKKDVWKGIYKKMHESLNPSQQALILNGDVVYKSSTIERTIKRAKRKIKFGTVYGRQVSRKGQKKLVFGWNAIIANREGLKRMAEGPNKPIGHLPHFKWSFWRGNAKLGKNFINLNRKPDIAKAKNLLRKKRWKAK